MLLILDSHPVQYRAPVYRRLEQICPGKFLVVYATDCSVRGYDDAGFGRRVAWDTPLLEGYPSVVLNSERGAPLNGFFSLSGRGLKRLFRESRPEAVLFTQFLYQYDFVGLWHAKRSRAKVWMRQETQDDSFRRSFAKSLARGWVYRRLYSQIDRAFYIGEKNKCHLIAHGVAEERLTRSPYITIDPLESVSLTEKLRRRRDLRTTLGFNDKDVVLGFFGKLILKKNPEILLSAVRNTHDNLRARLKVLYVGSGELEQQLRKASADAGLQRNVRFTGFVNQSQLTDYYLATDIAILPSRRMGETWGLVVNEALQAGCKVIVSNAVGCHPEFSHLSGFRVFPEDDSEAVSLAVAELAMMPREFDWATKTMEGYTLDAAAQPIAERILALKQGIVDGTA